MIHRFFVDTNVLIDVLTGRDGSEASRKLFACASLGRVSLSVSALSIVNAMYICKRYNLDLTAVAKALQNISTFVKIEDLTGKNVTTCLSNGWKDYEDSTQDFCAQEQSFTFLVTRNPKDFLLSSLTI